ncbi:MAG: hypothetical protein QNJ34_15080 [Xenococcaceae cyanobacterium MO_188.B29]|nr:hypothetical protein [Xenococcaceae cyanobacterium MO_188.B29]
MEQSPTQFLTQEESNQIEAALLSSSEKFLTRLTISSYRLLKIMAKDIGVSVDELTPTQIVEWMEKDSKIKREQGIDASVLKW